MSYMDALLKYQEADIRYDKIETALKGSAASKRLAKVRQFLEEQKRVLMKMNAAVDERRAIIRSTSERFDVYEKRYQEGAEKFEKADKENPDEVGKFSRYFDQLAARIASERREFTQLVNALEKEEKLLSDMRIRIAKARKEYDELKATVEKERADAKDELAAAKAQCDALAQDVDPKLLEAYQSIRRNHPVVVVEVVDNKCSGCNMELPAVAARKLREHELVECDNCGRILYIKENQ